MSDDHCNEEDESEQKTREKKTTENDIVGRLIAEYSVNKSNESYRTV